MKGFRSAGLSQEWLGYIGCGGRETIVANDTPEFQRNLAGRQQVISPPLTEIAKRTGEDPPCD
jgi:hypothetical protein